MKFTVPEGYSVVSQGRVVYSKAGIIDTDDKDLIAHLSQSPLAQKAKPATRKAEKQPEEGA